MPEKQPLGRFGTILVSIYGTLAFAALGRSSYELIAKFSQAPVPYALSALSAIIYVIATISMARGSAKSNRVARLAVSFELIGVVVVGLASLLSPNFFTYGDKPIHTVWSFFGLGYGFVPLVLPFIGLYWLGKRNAD